MTKPLFKYRGWAIFHAGEEDKENGTNLYGIHLTCKKEAGQEYIHDPHENDNVSWLSGEDPPNCWNCNAKVPEAIQAIMALHEWDTPDDAPARLGYV